MGFDILINLNNVSLLITFAVHLGFAAYIYCKDPRSEANRSLATLLFFVAGWVFTYILFYNVKTFEFILIIRRLSPAVAGFVVAYFVCFALVFPKREKEVPWIWKTLIMAPVWICSMFAIFSDLIIKSVNIVDPNFLVFGDVVFGPVFHLFNLGFVVYTIIGTSILVKKLFHADGRARGQILYVLFGGTLTLCFTIVTNVILPVFFGVSYFSGFIPVATLIVAGFMTHAIARHHLLNIEDMLSRGTYFLATVAAIVGTVFCLFTDNWAYLPLYYITLGHLAIGIVVLSYSWRNKINVSYAFLVFFTGTMIFSSAVFFNAARLPYILLAAKLIYVSTFFLMIPLFFFSVFFPFTKPSLSLLKALIIPVPGIVFAAVALFSDLLVRDVIFRSWGREVVFGPFFPVFAMYCTFFVGYTFAILVRKHNVSFGLQRTQVRYILISFLIIGVPNFAANIILPAFWQNYQLIQPALYFALPEAIFVAYAVLKHRLMSVEIMIQRGFVYASVTVFIMALYALAVIISETFFRQILGYSSLLISTMAALLIAVTYHPLVKSFQSFTDRLFFRGRYDYQVTLREISHKIASVIKLEELTRLIVSSFVDTMKVSEISFLLLDKNKERFHSVSLPAPRYKRIEIDFTSPIVAWISATKDVLVADELQSEIVRQDVPGKDGENRRHSLEEVRDEMLRLGISIWVPIISKDELIGIIALGNKLSGDIFSGEDIDLLGTLANQIAVALDNARLYDEVVNTRDYVEQILQSMVSGVLTVDTRTRIVTFNSMAEKITGRKIDEVIGKKCEEIWGNKGIICNIVENTLINKCYVNFDSSLASPEKGLVPVSFSSTLLNDSQGKKMGALITIQDQTEVKELEGKVRQADKLSALATMAAGMAHEIKNPLSSMKVLSQLIPRKIDDPEFKKKLAEIFPREINRIDRIVESLLGFARATAPAFEITNIENILEETLDYFANQAKEADVKIIKYFARLPEIEVDRSQISQVFSNLVLNAIQAMFLGGELRVSTLPGKKVDNFLRNVKIQISDSGHGIAEEKLKKLFDPFFTTKHGGTGLGLTITHSIVDGHKGYIDVVSQLGQGTTFTITLPVSQGLV